MVRGLCFCCDLTTNVQTKAPFHLRIGSWQKLSQLLSDFAMTPFWLSGYQGGPSSPAGHLRVGARNSRDALRTQQAVANSPLRTIDQNRGGPGGPQNVEPGGRGPEVFCGFLGANPEQGSRKKGCLPQSKLLWAMGMHPGKMNTVSRLSSSTNFFL